MTYSDFASIIQNYYGPYSKGSKVGDYVMSYLQRDIDESKLDKLFRYITYSHPYKFGPPGISEIETAIYEALKKHKGDDVHKIKDFTTSEKIEPESAEEYKQGAEMLDNAGGLRNMLSTLVKSKSFKKQEDRRRIINP